MANLDTIQVGSNYDIQGKYATYVTTAPTSANTDGIKICVLDDEPATRYDGWLYIITEKPKYSVTFYKDDTIYKIYQGTDESGTYIGNVGSGLGTTYSIEAGSYYCKSTRPYYNGRTTGNVNITTEGDYYVILNVTGEGTATLAFGVV